MVIETLFLPMHIPNVQYTINMCIQYDNIAHFKCAEGPTMKKATAVANALDGVSKAFYVKTEDGTSMLVLDIRVQFSMALPDPILDLVQERLQSMSAEIVDALQKDIGEGSE